MPFTVQWTGPTGPVRKKAPTAADALRWWTTYNREAANMVIKDDTGQRWTPDDLAKVVGRS
ncbi:hypothetical protein [Rubellimicrobium roseum]|uniref:Uncharacterized protein n=1 Tax=Rubellimicrobium roseum TaxID=687525 RepID=A0A5C4N486_9RHOB|nr:hypothetical protein [Rubellimicrobium roseum]TNC62063.1 hypothetical protein FHG71_20505 [Rubellimicrobium roseum]